MTVEIANVTDNSPPLFLIRVDDDDAHVESRFIFCDHRHGNMRVRRDECPIVCVYNGGFSIDCSFWKFRCYWLEFDVVHGNGMLEIFICAVGNF